MNGHQLHTVSLADGLKVGAIGLGCSPMSYGYGPGERNDGESVAVIRRALDLGINLFDTADVYGPGTNESLLGRALHGCREQAIIATKCGLIAEPGGRMRRDGRPEHIRAACADSLRRLQTEYIDLYQLHRVDRSVPLEETWGALAELVRAGQVRALGISHATIEELDLAHSIHPIAAIQYELSMLAPQNLIDVLPWCRRNGVGFLAFSPLGRGFLGGKLRADQIGPEDTRSFDPRFTNGAMRANEQIIRGLHRVAARHAATTGQIALAWVMAQGDNVVPIPGTKRQRWLLENAAAASIRLTDDDLREIAGLPRPVGRKTWDEAK